MKHNPPPFRQCPKDFEITNEERDQNDEEEGEEGGKREDTIQVEGAELNGSKESRTQKTSEKNVDQGRRVFIIPKVPVLQRLSTLETSHADGK